MKVVHVVRQFHPSVGGMEEVVLNIARRHLQQGRDQVEVVTLDRVFTRRQERLAQRDAYQGVPIVRLPYRGSSRYPLAPKVLAALRGADLVHVHGIDFFYDFLALTRVLHGTPMIVSTHGGFFHTTYASRLKMLWFKTLTRASARAYARVVATSENDGQVFSAVVAPQRLRVIENGVDVSKFAGQGSATPGRTLIYFGRWSVNKGLLETLDLLRALAAQDPAWQLIVAGREYDFTQADLLQAIAERGLQDRVQLRVAPSQEELAQLLGSAQYFVCLSRHEGFGLAAVEAMSAGLLPVLSDIPPFARLVRESAQGVLLDPADPQRAATAVQAYAAATDATFPAQRQAAMAYAQRYDWEHVVGAYLDEYRAVLGKTEAGR
ncbi:glycosyltransferase family 4 protein [Xanthomonas sp. CFBP 8703]|uniref:Glycosyltransferase family 4 protein n=1 Tax=Xanthomonas bonasiae TaxID=2810351 RepID=A0ABS3AYF6_9XANT|nr:glycosyltransferase family 4 protein [Xanthomonas bonasiae]MBN6101132.1 glycosyltransferase family 4 protein [Xanthomonas bonasiae]